MAKICISLIRETKYNSINSFPAGCLNAFSGSFSFSQYLLLTSVGRSTLKLSLIRQFAQDGMDHQSLWKQEKFPDVFMIQKWNLIIPFSDFARFD
jgi:hypothetical protein